MVKVGCGIAVVIDQAISRIREAPSKASNSHSRNAKGVTKSPTRRGKIAKGAHPKVMKVTQLAPSGVKAGNGDGTGQGSPN